MPLAIFLNENNEIRRFPFKNVEKNEAIRSLALECTHLSKSSSGSWKTLQSLKKTLYTLRDKNKTSS